MGFLPAVVAVAGAGYQAYASKKAGDANAQAEAQNAMLARLQAADARKVGAFEEGKIRTRAGQIEGQARAAVGANNVSGPSVQNIFKASAMAAEMDVQTARANAARQAWGYSFEAQQREDASERARKAGILGAVGHGVRGGGQAAVSLYGKYGKG